MDHQNIDQSNNTVIIHMPPAALRAAPTNPIHRPAPPGPGCLGRFATTNCVGQVVAHEVTKGVSGAISFVGLCVFGAGALITGPAGAAAISGASLAGFGLGGWLTSTTLSISALGPDESVSQHLYESTKMGLLGLCFPLILCCPG